MANDRPGLLQASSTDWDKAWDIVSKLGAARKQLEHDTVADQSLASLNAPDISPPADAGVPPPTDVIKTRTLYRPIAVWILIGVLWVSIGMIVSAAIVTIAYLA